MAKKTSAKKSIINVFGKTYKIIYEDLSATGSDALCSPDNSMIIVHKDLEDQELLLAILHEELHAVFNRLAYTQTINESLEEVMVESISQFIVDNYNLSPKT